MVHGKNWVKCGLSREILFACPVLNPIYILNQHIPPPKAIKSHSTSLDTFCGWPSFLHWILTLWLLAIYRHKKKSSPFGSVRSFVGRIRCEWLCVRVFVASVVCSVWFFTCFLLAFCFVTQNHARKHCENIFSSENVKREFRDWTPAICATIVAAACRCSIGFKCEEV